MTNIAVTTRKGGEGKTTLCFHIACGAATLGARVAIIDTDSQGHISTSLGINRNDALYEVMVNDVPMRQAVEHVHSSRYSTEAFPSRGELFVLPGFNKTARIASELETTDVLKLLHVVDRFKQEYRLDLVFFDTSPTVKEFDGFIYLATDAFLYVSQPEALSLDGLEIGLSQLRGAVQRRQDYLKRQSTVLGIIPNKVRGRTDAHTHVLGKMQERYGNFVWDPIRLLTVWAEASLFQEPLYTYAPDHPGTREAWRLTKRTIDAVRRWQAQLTP